jgi:hypothetical protein
MRGLIISAVIVLAALLGYLWWTGKGSSSDSAGGGSADSKSDGWFQFFNGIYFFEGPGPRDRNNNPGNLKAKRNGSWPGQIGTDPRGFAIFPDVSTGMEALQGYISSLVSKHPDWDFYDLFSYYLNGDTMAPTKTKEGDSNAYAEYVADQVGVDPTTPVAEAIGLGG